MRSFATAVHGNPLDAQDSRSHLDRFDRPLAAAVSMSDVLLDPVDRALAAVVRVSDVFLDGRDLRTHSDVVGARLSRHSSAPCIWTLLIGGWRRWLV